MFGSSKNNSLFGTVSDSSTAFGSNSSPFGVQSKQNMGPFGTMSGQQPKQPLISFGLTSPQPLFGSTVNTKTTNTPTFSFQSTSGGFGGNRSSFFVGNKQNNSLFGANHLDTNSKSEFQFPPFGKTPISFKISPTITNGTTIKFRPMIGIDRNTGVLRNTRYQCITFMNEYKNKSLEELRLEDYIANGKVSQQNNSMFGSTTTNVILNSESLSFMGKECNICCERPINSVLYKCGHICMCYTCAMSLRKERRRCPICRAEIKDVIKGYLSY